MPCSRKKIKRFRDKSNYGRKGENTPSPLFLNKKIIRMKEIKAYIRKEQAEIVIRKLELAGITNARLKCVRVANADEH